MHNLKTVLNSIKKLNANKIIVSFLLATALFLTTTLSSNMAIAASNNSATTYPTDDKDLDGLLYDNDNEGALKNKDDLIDPKIQDKLLDPTQIPAVKQPTINRTNPDNKLLEKTGEMFDDSGVLGNE